MSIRRACTVVVAVSVFVACASETGDSPASTVVVSTAAATTNPVVTATSEPTSTARPNAAVSRWTEDMEALGDGIRRIHPNPFWRQSEAEFDASLEAAPEHLAALSDNDARAEVMRLTARIDGHTGVYLGEVGFHLYAIHLYAFGDDIHIIAASDPAMFGATVLSIDGMPSAAAPDDADDSGADAGEAAKVAAAVGGGTPEAAAGDGDDVPADDPIMALMAAAYAERSPDGPDHFAVVAAKGFHLFSIEPELTVDDLAMVSVAVLLMAGDDDLIPLSHTAAFFAALPEAQLAIVPGASHGLPMEHPPEVVGLIERFLASAVPPATMMPNLRT